MSMDKTFSLWRPHPWHGISLGSEPPRIVNAYIEITPFDLVKYEIDKSSGYLRVDRPQRTSSQPPALYGFIPRTYCGEKFHSLSPDSKQGDGDPLDICIISERAITKSEVILSARVVGGIQMIDHEEADDKIVAVLNNDLFWKNVEDIKDLPDILIERLVHYFKTYKLVPDQETKVAINQVYGQDHAYNVINAAVEDYNELFNP
ncbi:MAG: inorganic pyrophosphatase [Anaerolineales bacterium]